MVPGTHLRLIISETGAKMQMFHSAWIIDKSSYHAPNRFKRYKCHKNIGKKYSIFNFTEEEEEEEEQTESIAQVFHHHRSANLAK